MQPRVVKAAGCLIGPLPPAQARFPESGAWPAIPRALRETLDTLPDRLNGLPLPIRCNNRRAVTTER
jgi:hypothetical protein